MQAIRVEKFGDPSVLALAEVSLPAPGPGQVLVEIKAAGVNPVETYIRSGTYAFRPELPYTPGSDGAGVVAAVGEGVAGLAVGDRVFVSGAVTGTYGQQAVCLAAHVHPLPEGLTFAQGAAVGVPFGTAYRALFHRGAARKGETLLVHGASGGVGTAAVQLGRAAGLRVFGTAGTAEGRTLVEKLGAESAFDHHEAGYRDALQAFADGRGLDIILEMLANVNLGHDLPLLARGGRVVVVGNRGTVEINPRDLMQRDADVRGMIFGLATPEERAEIFRDLGEMLAAGLLSPVIGREFSLAEASLAHEAVLAGGSQGKIVLIP